jgi:hypothetical protein
VSQASLSPAQSQVLNGIGETYPPERVDRLWIFSPHEGKTRETGLFVLSLFGDSPDVPDQRVLLTVRYDAEPTRGGVLVERSVTEEGRAPSEMIQRVISGVLHRSGDDVGEPLVEAIEGDPLRWAEVLTRLGVVA